MLSRFNAEYLILGTANAIKVKQDGTKEMLQNSVV